MPKNSLASLAEVQRSMYQRLQRYARLRRPRPTRELRRYISDYQSELGGSPYPSNKSQLIQAVTQAPITIVGDYHTLPQAQRTLIRILRATEENRKSSHTFIALEWLRPEDNFHVARFLRRQISESDFLDRVGYRRNWGFPWENYRPLFEYARERGVSIIGLSKGGEKRLKARDRFAATRIASVFVLHPDAHVFALVGDLHLAKRHLPAALPKALKQYRLSRRVLCVHQNIERYYWALLEKGLQDKIDVVRLTKDSYCVLATPPWVKLQSHLQWLELTLARSSTQDAFHEIDFSDEVSAIVGQISSFLNLGENIPVDFQIRGPNDLSVISRDRLTKEQGEKLRAFLIHFESFFMPESHTLFLSQLSINQLAALSSLLIYCSRSEFRKFFENPHRDFYDFVWLEALGFFGSKIMNPKRKCNGIHDLQQIVALKPLPKRHREFTVTPEVARWCLFHLRSEPRTRSVLPKRTTTERLVFYYKNAKTLGHILGNGLYRAAVSGRVSKSELRRIFSEHPPEARAEYRHWAEKLKRWGLRDQSKNERF